MSFPFPFPFRFRVDALIAASRPIPGLLCAVLLLLPGLARAEVVVVLNSGEATISLIDKDSYKVTETFPIGKEPHHLMVSPDDKQLLVANAVGNELVVLDPLSGKIQRRIAGIDDPYQISFSPNQQWFAVNGNRLDRIDLYNYDGRSLNIVKRISLGKTPSHLVFTNDSKTLFVTLQDSNEIAAIDMATQSVLWKMTVGPAPAGIWLTPDEKYLLVGMTGGDYVEVIDWRAKKSIKRIETGRGAHNFRALGDKRHVLLSNRVSSSISIIDQQTLEKIGDITGLPFGPDDMEVTADGQQLWVTCRFSRTVAVVDLPSRKVIQRIAVGRSPHGLYFKSRAPLI